MGDTAVQQPVAAFVPATIQRDQLVSTTDGAKSTYAAVSRANVSDIPGRSGPVSGVKVDLGRKIIGRHESSYFFPDSGGVYRSGIGDPWRPVSDPAELQRVGDVLGRVREGNEAQRRAPEQVANIGAIDTAMGRLPPTVQLASTHPANAMEPPTASTRPATTAQPGPGAPGTSPDGRVAFKSASTVEGLLGYPVKLTPQVDMGTIKAGTNVSVDTYGNVWAHGQGHVPRYGPEAAEVLSYAWARHPEIMPKKGPDALVPRGFRPMEAAPLPLARVHAVLRANETIPTR